MKKISLVLALILVFALFLSSCDAISFISSSQRQNAPTRVEGKVDFNYAVVGDGDVNGAMSKVIISDGNGIQNGAIGGDESEESEDDLISDLTPGNIPEFNGVKLRDIIHIGTYEQDNVLENGKEAIEWVVLDIKDGRALVISKCALDQKKMHPTYDSITWENCATRQWLNSDFINSAFTDAERAKIVPTDLAVDPEPEFNDPNSSYMPGNPTTDKVFFLSVTEANRYFINDADRACMLTPYAATKEVNKGEYAYWWLRNGGSYWDCFSFVSFDGYVFADGTNASASGYTIRPAMWIDIG